MWKIRDLQKLSVTEVLLCFLLWAAAIWCSQILWKRRHLYKASIGLPGPLALPFIGSAFYFIGNPYDTFGQITQMFNNYPSIFRVWFGPRLFYAVSDPKYFEILFTSPHMLAKEKLYELASPVVGEGLFSAMSVSHWKKHRKIIMTTFNQKILDGFMDIFAEQSQILSTVLEKYENQDVDISKLMTKCTLDIICETAMGVQIKAQSTETEFPKWVDRVLEIVMIRIFNIFYHSDVIFRNSPLGRDFHYCTDRIRSFTREVLAEKKANYKKNCIEPGTGILQRKAFLDLLLGTTNEGDVQLFTDEELIDETITLLVAGSDTTAATNCFTLTMLGMHKKIQEKVLTEILEIVGPKDNVELHHLPQLKYLERVIKETLRLFPVGPFLVRTADNDVDLGDFVIQKGCSVVFGILRAHTNEKYWPEPYSFDPDRFLPEEVAKRPAAAYIPFSYGPRNCIGLKYGMMTMKTLLATVIRKYKVSTSYKSVRDIELQTYLILRPKDGYKVKLESRNL